ncbi:glycine--tRNA ligase subunit beta [Cyanobacterium aponinum FACHB-4101]|uniref:glycine--tRNA ligase subunit beta n=1 Tax=Cyanobacterium aponinum TaxID=379064 RepID=UPI001681391E|nr:glycine--tRNA ligase subunit beta [Cyanobacterium aponinum]MBD2395983.1 glycine--tRNA ligase subunit beta [Cyanobacterium aponinum FACHB-4101]
MANFLLEIGTEELPADFVDSAIAQWDSKIKDNLKSEFLEPTEIKIYGTPRRLAVLIEGLAEKQPDREEEIKGPPVTAAFKDGKATPAAEGFARKQGVSLEDFQVRETEKGEFIFIQKKMMGEATKDILQRLVPQWITGLEGRRFMRWADDELRFPRPIRHLVALWDSEILPLELNLGTNVLRSDRISTGHRVLHPATVVINSAQDYVATLEKASVLVDVKTRYKKIEEEIKHLATLVKGKAEIYPDLLTEVTNLVEYPTPVLGKFEAEFLQLPSEVITTVMVTHQRYFPIKDEKGELMPYFITISNGDPTKSDIIATGNAKVIRARLADAQFFYQADCDEHLETYLPELENVTFQEDLGTMHDKVNRIIGICQQISEQLGLNELQKSEVESTASLCKADLVTQMVYEFPELQGIMGEKYALKSGESPTVAKGIFEHYLPRSAGDIMPETLNGQIVGIGDRIDTIVGIIGLGMMPTGSSDPFALRRSANAIINITWHGNLEINLEELLTQACEDFVTSHPDKKSPLNAIQEFFTQRIHTLLQDELNIDYDLVNAVLGDNDSEYITRALTNLLDIRNRALFLQEIRNNGLLSQIYETVNRSTKLAVKGSLKTDELEINQVINPEYFESNSEQDLYQALQKLAPISQEAKRKSNYQLLIDGLLEINPIISNFFDGENSVLVMAEDEKIKTNRLNLLGLLRNYSRVLADFGAIVK